MQFRPSFAGEAQHCRPVSAAERECNPSSLPRFFAGAEADTGRSSAVRPWPWRTASMFRLSRTWHHARNRFSRTIVLSLPSTSCSCVGQARFFADWSCSSSKTVPPYRKLLRGERFLEPCHRRPVHGRGYAPAESQPVDCDVLGFDINPVEAWIVRDEIEHLDINAHRTAVDALTRSLNTEIGGAHRTDCPIYGGADGPVKYFFWIKIVDCVKYGRAPGCGFQRGAPPRRRLPGRMMTGKAASGTMVQIGRRRRPGGRRLARSEGEVTGGGSMLP